MFLPHLLNIRVKALHTKLSTIFFVLNNLIVYFLECSKNTNKTFMCYFFYVYI